MASLNENKANATLEKVDNEFIIKYDIKASEDDASGECIEQKLVCAMNYVLTRMDNSVNYLLRQIDDLYNRLGAHTEGHLPKLTPSALSKLIKTAGMDDDYVVVPRQIWASQTGAVEFGAQELSAAIKKINEDKVEEKDADISRLMEAIKNSQKK